MVPKVSVRLSSKYYNEEIKTEGLLVNQHREGSKVFMYISIVRFAPLSEDAQRDVQP